jgi:hypothetical protein
VEVISTAISKRDKKSNEITEGRLQTGIEISVILVSTLKIIHFNKVAQNKQYEDDDILNTNSILFFAGCTH